MSKRFLFVIVSKDDKFKMSKEEFAGIGDVQMAFIPNNKDKLSVVYNRELYSAREIGDHDFVVFMHADVKLDLKHFISHIEEVADKYDVIGLCGTTIVNVSQSPLNWYTGSRLNPDQRWGCVTHSEHGMMQSFFSKDREAVTDHEVACIDGMCIVFGPKAIADKELNFDTQFSFDFYDTDISFQCLMQRNLKLGVIVEPSLVHDSIGRSITTDEFLVHEIDFRKKWKLDIPDKSKLQLINNILNPSNC